MAAAGAGHITNYAQNENGDVWSLQQLAQHMGTAHWQVSRAQNALGVLAALPLSRQALCMV